MTQFREANLPYTALLLDPNNYRFQDSPDFQTVDKKRFHEQKVQDAAYNRLDDESLVQLKNSIKRNGFLPVERIVVRPYEYQPGLYKVVEGNRRLAALRWIARDHNAGINAPESVLSDLENLPVLILEDGTDDVILEKAVMGVRHVSGIKEWGSYQRTRLVVLLRDEYDLENAEIADRLGMKPHEVHRRYRAFKALQQMENDDEFGEFAKPEMYVLFHEALGQPVVRTWLGWNDADNIFTDQENLRQFYELIPPRVVEERTFEPKIETFQDVRHLKEILNNVEAKAILLDPLTEFLDAYAMARRDELTRSWINKVSSAISALRNVTLPDIKGLSEEDLVQLEELRNAVGEIIEGHTKLKA